MPNYPERFNERVENLFTNIDNFVKCSCVGDYNKAFTNHRDQIRNFIAMAMDPWDQELMWMQEDRDAWAKKALG